jgi:hypothetical protein
MEMMLHSISIAASSTRELTLDTLPFLLVVFHDADERQQLLLESRSVLVLRGAVSVSPAGFQRQKTMLQPVCAAADRAAAYPSRFNSYREKHMLTDGGDQDIPSIWSTPPKDLRKDFLCKQSPCA